MYHSFIKITPDNQALYAHDSRFQNIDANGNRFATIGAGSDALGLLEAGVNRPTDVNEPIAYKKDLKLPCSYKNEDAAIKRLFQLSNNYNKHKLFYTLLPQRVFGMPTGYNSNSFAAGLGQAAGFDMPAPGATGEDTPGYQNPIPPKDFGIR